ncbi:MAG: NAD(P)/FAD-dependent oxidoreductase [Cellvibrionales bacterium]|nr:NAD(P)/FAD-dependent oxidoreductase [Cellvibrionales bacterium]
MLAEGGHFDVLVIGAGPAGSLTARALSMWGFKTAIVQKDVEPVKFTEVLPPSSMRAICAQGLVNLIHSSHSPLSPCSGVTSHWGEGRIYEDDFIRRPESGGWVVERTALDAELQSLAVSHGAIYRKIQSIDHIETYENGWIIIVDDDVSFTCRFVIDASGRPSTFARRVGAKRQVTSKLFAGGINFVGQAVDDIGESRLFVKSHPEGWSYSISHPEHYLSAVLVSSSSSIKNKASLEKALGKIYPQYVDSEAASLDRVLFTDASSFILDHVAGENWLAVGDAAASFDPITSQGLANAFSSSLIAAHTCREFLLNRNFLALEAYDKAIRDTWSFSDSGRLHVYQQQDQWTESLR